MHLCSPQSPTSPLIAYKALPYTPSSLSSVSSFELLCVIACFKHQKSKWTEEWTEQLVSTPCCHEWMLAAVISVLQAQRSDFLLVFHPPQAHFKLFSSAVSPSRLSSLLIPIFFTLDSRPFHSPASYSAWKNRPAISHTLLICPTSVAMWLLNIFSCVCVCVCLSHTLWCFSPLPVIIFSLLHPLSAVGPPHPVSVS